MRASLLAAALGLSCLATFAPACGTSNDCTEKATCPDPSDGAAGVDVLLGADGGHAGDAAHDGMTGADSSSDSSTSDATPAPDSPSMCGGVCADAVPTGWSGPVTLFDQTGPPAPAAPACPTSFPTNAYDGNADLDAPTETCGCSCGGGAGAQCGQSTIQYFTDPGCVIACNPGVYGLPPGLCVTTGCASNPDGLIVTAPGVSFAGSCTPQSTSTIPPSTWNTTGRACGTTAVNGLCSGSGVCVPSPPAPFAKVCVFQAGAATCPGGSYSVAHVFYGGVSDSRACSGCSCGSPTGVSCAGAQVQAFSTNTGTCGGTAADVPFISGCQTVGVTIQGEEETTAPTASNGTCTASGGQASGTATPATPTTVCCTP